VLLLLLAYRPQMVAGQALGGPGVRGHLLSLSDVATIPDMPLAGVAVFAVAADQFGALLADAGVAPAAPGSLQWLGQLQVAAGSWSHYVVASDSTAADGGYHLDLDPGSYVVCMANIDDRDPSRRPVAVDGCVPLNVRADAETPLELRVGLQGLVSQP
jgi:hypothetical protein